MDDAESALVTNYSIMSTTSAESANTTTEVNDEEMMLVAKWSLGFIILLGLFTNTLILIILSRKKIGSEY